MRKLTTPMLVMFPVLVLGTGTHVQASGCESSASALTAQGVHFSPALALKQVRQRELDRMTMPGPVYVIGRSASPKRITEAQLKKRRAHAVDSLLKQIEAVAEPGDTIHFLSTSPKFHMRVAEGRDGFVVVRKGCIVRSFGMRRY